MDLVLFRFLLVAAGAELVLGFGYIRGGGGRWTGRARLRSMWQWERQWPGGMARPKSLYFIFFFSSSSSLLRLA
ncbi:hypothetical protein BDY21DRAFT_351032 [Lineolata rhizophorae]|uniref:Uncharacterized protein n=1 Tax=Lineolata rhizophorae TaxID=578093 RepID=A0A6A6NUW0_9PEZI|nr:hypothetical protein BDY21DRAFT_351032 [Lineolata rhizophorae]